MSSTSNALHSDIDILIVEDSLMQAMKLEDLLNEHGYHVQTARDGSEAIALLKEHKPAIIISDIMMPQMDGYEFCRRVKADQSLQDIPVILLTSLSDPLNVIRGLECGADNFITKPYRDDFLLSRIHHILVNMEMRRNGGAEMGLEVFFGGKKRRLTSERIQIIDLLLSTFETAVEKNAELEESSEQLREAGQKISALQEDYRSLLESNADAMIVVNQDGIVRYANRAAESMLGRKRDELLGQSLGFPVMMNETKELELGQRDGQVLFAEMQVRETNWEGEKACLASLRDITGRKHAMEAVKEANRAKSEFLANMSHEIRTPMNGVIGMTELALDTELTSEQRDYLETVKASADSLLTVINEILDFSKIEAGKLTLETTGFSLRDSIGDTLDTLALRAHQKGLELAYCVAPDVPDALLGDPGRLRQIIVNLVGNAVKFTEHGEVVIRVVPALDRSEAEESQTEDGGRLHFAVTDTGVGIPPQKQQSIFDAFAQVDGATTRKYGGTGLGLAISSQLAKMMGGRICIESEVGKGSTFHFSARFGLQKDPAEKRTPTLPVNVQGLPVLVVDDNATNRRILKEMLTNWRMKPTAVDDGQAALDAMQQASESGEPFALVLLDAMMPEMDGFSLAERIRQNPDIAGAALIMLSSAGHRGNDTRSRELDISAYLTKPIKQSDLLNAIMTVLGAPPDDKQIPLPTSHSLQAGERCLHILLAEDNGVNQKLAVRLLEKRGHTVVVANDGRQALAALEKQPFDLVLMDVQMPEMNGFEATAAIRERESVTGAHTPLVAMTAYAMKGDRERCIEAGMDDYISKPVQAKELFEIIEGLAPLRAENEASSFRGRNLSAHQTQVSEVLDKEAVLTRVCGDMELMKEIVVIFLDECPRLLSDIRDAVARSDSRALHHAAHALKGSVGNFCAKAAFDAALRLEMIGRDGDMASAEEACAALEEKIECLKPALAELGKEEAA